jgi:glutaminyl-tRNA synthetase
VTAYAEPSLRQTLPEDRVQFERQGYFVADRHDHHRDRGTLVFNRVTALKEADRPA